MTCGRLLAWGLLVGTALAQGPVPDASAVFGEANELFRQANLERATDPQRAAELYRRAALRYEQLLGELGVQSAKLHYNLANTYHQLEDIGRAILHYRRAERLDPNDANVRRNLDYARTRRQDRLERAGGGQALETLLFWHYEFSPAARVRLFAGAWVLFWGGLLVRLWGKAWVPREALLGLGLAACLLLVSMAYEAAAEGQAVAGVVVAPDTVARQGDGPGYEPSFEDPLHSGAEFEVLEERPDWLHVELPDGRRCWLAARDLELVP